MNKWQEPGRELQFCWALKTKLTPKQQQQTPPPPSPKPNNKQKRGKRQDINSENWPCMSCSYVQTNPLVKAHLWLWKSLSFSRQLHHSTAAYRSNQAMFPSLVWALTRLQLHQVRDIMNQPLTHSSVVQDVFFEVLCCCRCSTTDISARQFKMAFLTFIPTEVTALTTIHFCFLSYLQVHTKL